MSQTISHQWERASNLAQGKVVKLGHRRGSRELSIAQKKFQGETGRKMVEGVSEICSLDFGLDLLKLQRHHKKQHIIQVIIFNRELKTDLFKSGTLKSSF